MTIKKDLTGRRFERLTVMCEIEKKPCRNIKWLCKCDCGKIATVTTSNLNSGGVKSCGCLHIEKLKDRSTRHGFARSNNVHPLYNAWHNIIQRCLNKKSIAFKDYGARQINIYPPWRKDPELFVKWGINNGWKPGLTIDRKNNNLGYYPDNCWFTTQKEQMRNTRRTMFLTLNGKKRPLSKWAEILKIKPYILWNRINRSWSVEKTLTTPIRTYQKQ